jgi:cell division septation protein DedD
VRFRRVPGISWALVFAGLLGGGALSFGAGVITGTQMTVVAYRGALPIATAPDPGPTAGAGGPSPPRTLLPRERQVAAHSNAATPAAVAGRRAGTPGSAAPAAPAAGADVTDVASLVSLPQRTRWQPPAPPQAGHAGEANPETRRSAAAARAAPPVPRPRPDGLAPQRLTPTDGTQGPGDAAAQHPSSAVPAAPIWRITAPSDAAALPGRWPLFPDGLARSTQLTPSAHWAPAPRESRTPDAGRTPQAAPPAPRPTPTDAAAAVVPQGRYSVQVGAFRDPANASAQAARLSAAGYTPRIVHARATQSRLYMVRLGAFPDRPAASAFASQIADRLDIDTWPVAN